MTRRPTLAACAAFSICFLLAGCGGLSDGAIERAMEKSWERDPTTMAIEAGLADASEAEPGMVRGAQSSARKIVGAVRGYAGDAAGDATQDVLGSAAELSEQFGAGKSPGFERALARDWDVRNLEVLEQRASGEDYVVRARYDVYATFAGERRLIGKDVSQSLRLVRHDGGWILAK